MARSPLFCLIAVKLERSLLRIDSLPEDAGRHLPFTNDGRGDLIEGDLLRVNLPDVRQDYLLTPGNVLFASPGRRKQAMAIDDDLETTTFGTQFFVIEARDGVLPVYLAWYINQQPAQRYLEEHSMGSNVRVVTKEALSRMPIQLPPLEVQRRDSRYQIEGSSLLDTGSYRAEMVAGDGLFERTSQVLIFPGE